MIGRGPRVLKEVVAAELVQVEVAEVLNDDEGNLDLLELRVRSLRHRVRSRVLPSIIQFTYHSRTGLSGVLLMKVR